MVFLSFFFYFLKNVILPADRRIFWNKNHKNEKKKQKRTFWTDFQLKKGQSVDRFSTVQHICCVYIYIWLTTHHLGPTLDKSPSPLRVCGKNDHSSMSTILTSIPSFTLTFPLFIACFDHNALITEDMYKILQVAGA